MIKKSTWKVNWPVVPQEDEPAFQSQVELLSLPMEVVTSDKFSGVSRLSLGSQYYVKTYSGRGERLKQLLGVSRFQREIHNLSYFSSLGLATPQLVVVGEQSAVGFLLSGLMVTAAVPNSLTMEELIAGDGFYAAGRPAVRQVLNQLADALRALHSDGFFHRDLKTRNILVADYPVNSMLYFFDCPSGYRPSAVLRQRSIMRDLAYLERGLRGHLRTTDLLYLFKKYQGRDKLDDEDKLLARTVLRYYGNRRLTKKRKERAARKNAKEPTV
jgi:tRNA A-37 threonylcarbamoyl transferase component Bud32